jgi:3-hydroxybutyryl-CoA dehydrogenase
VLTGTASAESFARMLSMVTGTRQETIKMSNDCLHKAQVKSEANPGALEANALVAVIGAGTMGAGIATVAAMAGHTVILYDSNPAASAAAVAAIKKDLGASAEKERISFEQASLTGERLSVGEKLSSLKDASLIVEAIVENLSVKKELLRSLESFVTTDCILATNTSSISISRLASGLQRSERVVGMHFFNPATKMRLVEVIEGLETRPEVAKIIFETAKLWGKQPVYAKSTPGFIVNRVARPYYAEALRLLGEGAADPATIDAIMHDCAGFRMGPFELMDLIGNDVNFSVTKSIFEAFYFDPRFTPSVLQQELVDAGHFGRKTGRGFHDYSAGALPPAPKNVSKVPALGKISLQIDTSFGKALLARLPGSIVVEELAVDTTEPLMKVGEACIYVTDGRTANEHAFANGKKNVILCDSCLDYSQSTRVAVTKASLCTEEALLLTIGVFQDAKFAVSVIEDVAGMVVMRTVCMIVNEAFDLVNQQVCSEEALDTAMQLGMNYPLGPIGWTSLFGAETVYTVLKNLGRHYGEDRYRISPRISSKHWTSCA